MHLCALRRLTIIVAIGRDAFAQRLSVCIRLFAVANGRELLERFDLARLNVMNVLTADVYAAVLRAQNVLRDVFARLRFEFLRLLHRLLHQMVACEFRSVNGEVGMRSNFEQLNARPARRIDFFKN